MATPWDYLERSANVCVIIGVALLGVFLLRTPSRLPVDIGLKSGDLVSQVDRVKYADADKTLLIYVSSQCQFCSASMGFYRALAEQERQAAGEIQVAALSREHQNVLETYLRENGLNVKAATIGADTLSKLQQTPTLLLVNRTGHLERFWVGQLDRDAELAVFEALGLADPRAGGS